MIQHGPTSAAIVARLRHDAGLLAEHGLAATAEAILTWLDGTSSDTFESSLGLPCNGRHRARLEARDEQLVMLAQRWFPTLQGRALAQAVACAASRYARSSWPRNRLSTRRPDGINGDLFDILSHGEIPGDARLRQIFNGIAG